MTFTAMMLMGRREGTTPAQFREYLEKTHIPLLQSISGPLFPLSYRNNYIERPAWNPTSPDCSNYNFPTAVLLGSSEEFAYDVYSELVFENKNALYNYWTCITSADHAQTVLDDLSNFADHPETRMIAIGESRTTFRAAKPAPR